MNQTKVITYLWRAICPLLPISIPDDKVDQEATEERFKIGWIHWLIKTWNISLVEINYINRFKWLGMVCPDKNSNYFMIFIQSGEVQKWGVGGWEGKLKKLSYNTDGEVESTLWANCFGFSRHDALKDVDIKDCGICVCGDYRQANDQLQKSFPSTANGTDELAKLPGYRIPAVLDNRQVQHVQRPPSACTTTRFTVQKDMPVLHHLDHKGWYLG